jgi:MinD-like ATPase involved in chromosome partitioning or flagellar assembly
MSNSEDQVTVLLAAPTNRVRAWYTALSRDSRLEISSYSNDLVDLQHKLETMDSEVLVLDADLFDGPDALRDMLLSVQGVLVFLVLPPQAGEEQIEHVLNIPSVAGGWVGDVDLPAVAGEIYEAAMRVRGASPPALLTSSPAVSFTPGPPIPVASVPSSPTTTFPASFPSTPEPAKVSPPPPGGSRVIAFWSGPAGGTGCTTLALAFSALAASRDASAILLALSEPAVSTYLHLDRVPNINSFFTANDRKLQAASQRIGWGAQAAPVGMHVILGPARPCDGEISAEQLSAVIEAARGAYSFTAVDMPSLTPGGTVWSVLPLKHATDIVLVMAPTVTGISATVEALVILRDVAAPGRVHVALNQRFPSGAFAPRDFRAGVEAVWGSCPDVTKVGFVDGLPGSMNEGEIPDSDILGGALGEIGEFAGLPASPTQPGEGRKRFSLGRLGKLRITMTD